MSAGGRERSCRPRRRSSGCAPTRWSTPNAGSKPASPSGCWTASITCSASISRRASSTTVGPEPARDPCGHREPPGDLSRTATRDDSETVNFRGMGRTLGQIWASSPWPKSRGPSVPISRTTAWRRSSHPLQGSAASPHRLVPSCPAAADRDAWLGTARHEQGSRSVCFEYRLLVPRHRPRNTPRGM